MTTEFEHVWPSITLLGRHFIAPTDYSMEWPFGKNILLHNLIYFCMRSNEFFKSACHTSEIRLLNATKIVVHAIYSCKTLFSAKSSLYGGYPIDSIIWLLKYLVVGWNMRQLALCWWRMIRRRLFVFLISHRPNSCVRFGIDHSTFL